MRKFALMALALLGTACSPGNGAQYLQIAMGQPSAFSGTNCPPASPVVVTDVNIDGLTNWAIYPAPSNQYLLEGPMSGDLLAGSAVNGGYNFSGVQQITVTGGYGALQKMTVSLAPATQGPGYTGSVTTEASCTATNNAPCQGGGDGHSSFDCSQTTAFTAIPVTNVQQQHDVQAGAGAASQSGGLPPGGTGGTGGMGGTSGGGSSGGGSSGGSGPQSFAGVWTGPATVTTSSGSKTATDTENVQESGSTVDFTNYLGLGCQLSMQASGNTAFLQSPVSCTDSQQNQWSFQTGTASVAGTSMTVNVTGQMMIASGGQSTPMSFSVSEQLTKG